jgi:hypothetical protein
MVVSDSTIETAIYVPILANSSGSPYVSKDILYAFARFIISIILIMSHLVQQSISRIENNLLWVKSVRDSIFAWWFNIILLLLVVGSFGYFLYASYGTAPSEELQKIPFEPRTWNNAVRNVPISNYGQTPQVETGVGVSGFKHRTGASDF